jgi:hypothetical protein
LTKDILFDILNLVTNNKIRKGSVANMRNFTPHSIKIIDQNSVVFDSKIRKYVPGESEPVILVEFPSNGMLSGKIETVPGELIDGVPTYVKKVVGCDPLPDGDDMLIVSAIYAVAARQSGFCMDRLLVIADPVVTPDGNQILGCIGVGPAM